MGTNNIISFESLQLIITFFGTLLASSGFWVFMTKRSESRDINRRLLMGLAHDRIRCLCLEYIHDGCITQDEYENLRKYLYEPYSDIGGNGTVKRLMMEVDKLPIVNNKPLEEKREKCDDVKQ